MHDKRDERGMYRELTSAETRARTARDLTQTHEGVCTHSREPKRQTFQASPPLSTPMFRKGRTIREPYNPFK